MSGQPSSSGAAPFVLELAQIAKTYPGDPPVHALRDVNLQVRQGECLAVVGASGSGKSTLLSVMGTLDRQSRGVVRLAGFDTRTLSDEQLAALRARSIGFVFQQFFLLDNATALENVENGLLYTGVPKEERTRRAMAALERVGLGQRRQFLPVHMSGGERQRVAIARALIANPALVLADEPTGNLDTASGSDIVDLLLELNRQGTTVVVVTHDPTIAARIPRRIDVRDGQIVADSAVGGGRVQSDEAPAPQPSPERELPKTARLRPGDLARVAAFGLRSRRLRTALSALGIAIGVAAVVAVLGLSASSQAGLLQEIDRLGTNLLTVTPGSGMFGNSAELPTTAPGMITRMDGVRHVADIGGTDAEVFRSPLIPSYESGGLTVDATSLDLLSAIGTKMAQGRFLNAATAKEPVAVLGAAAARQLGIDRLFPGERIWLGGQWFYIAGILKPAALTPEIDSSVLVGFPAAEHYLGFDGHPTNIYVRTQQDSVQAVYGLLARQAYPESPSSVNVSQPSQALVARAAAKNAFTGLFVGLGAVALFVGGVGVANIMVISVLERRREIGLRRALGATRRLIRSQFLGEAILLSLGGGVVGIGGGALATLVYAWSRHWLVVVPLIAWTGGLAAALTIGAIAGYLPAKGAANLSPTEALRAL